MNFSTKKRHHRGAVAVLVAICLIPIVIAMSYVLDGGALMSQRRQTQAVADATAHAAACLLAKNYATNSGLDPLGTARAAALAIAAANGFANDGTNTVIAINIPPSAGTYAGVAGCVEVVATYRQPRYFSSIMGSGRIPVTARSVSRVVADSPLSILVTDPLGLSSFSLTGSAKLTTNGKVHVNSSSLLAVNASNGGFLKADGGLRIVGNYSIPNWALFNVFFNLAPKVNQPSLSDPYASLAPPPTSGLTNRSAPNPPYGSATINPGIYNGGLTLGGGMTITMNPGIYYMKNGSFTVANGVTLTGSGVTIYTDSSGLLAGVVGGGSLNFQGGTTVKLTPPTSGPYKGIVYYQDRGNVANLNNIANGSNVNMTGTIYAPSAPLSIAGGAAGSSYGSQLIVKTLALSNGVNVTVNASLTGNTVSFLNVVE